MSEQRETPAPAPAALAADQAEVHPTNGTDTVGEHQSADLEIGEEEPPPVVRMRQSAAMNGQSQQASVNGHAAVQRGLEALAENEMSQNNEEIKKLDTQLDHFNKYMEKFEKKNTELNERLSNLVKSQKEERVKRRASFMQREEEMKQQQDSFDSQLRQMFAKCAQMRRTSAPVIADSGVQDMLEHSRRIREGSNETPIHEVNGHEETEPAAN